METDILWEPEIGTCGQCGDRGCRVRQYSSEGRVRKFCFKCWDTHQEPRVMSSMDWEDDDRILFTYPAEEPPSKAA